MQMYWQGWLGKRYVQVKTFLRCGVLPPEDGGDSSDIHRYLFADGESWTEDGAGNSAKWLRWLKKTGCENAFLPDIGPDNRYDLRLRCVFPERTTEWRFGYRPNRDDTLPHIRGIYEYRERRLPQRIAKADTADPSEDFKASVAAVEDVLPDVRYDDFGLREDFFRKALSGILHEFAGTELKPIYPLGGLTFGEQRYQNLYNAAQRAWAFLGGCDSRNEGMPPDLLDRYDHLLAELALQSTRALYYALNFWSPDCNGT